MTASTTKNKSPTFGIRFYFLKIQKEVKTFSLKPMCRERELDLKTLSEVVSCISDFSQTDC